VLVGGLWLVLPAFAGSAWLDPATAEVESKATFHYYYQVGAGGMEVGDGIRLHDPEFQGIRWSQWGTDVLDASACTAV